MPRYLPIEYSHNLSTQLCDMAARKGGRENWLGLAALLLGKLDSSDTDHAICVLNSVFCSSYYSPPYASVPRPNAAHFKSGLIATDQGSLGSPSICPKNRLQHLVLADWLVDPSVLLLPNPFLLCRILWTLFHQTRDPMKSIPMRRTFQGYQLHRWAHPSRISRASLSGSGLSGSNSTPTPSPLKRAFSTTLS